MLAVESLARGRSLAGVLSWSGFVRLERLRWLGIYFARGMVTFRFQRLWPASRRTALTSIRRVFGQSFRGGERIRLALDEEMEAGRRCLARGRPEEFAAEQAVGRNWAERAQARLELEQDAGRRASAKRVWL